MDHTLSPTSCKQTEDERPIQKIVVGGLIIDVLSHKEWAARIVRYCQNPSSKRPVLHFSVNGQVIANCASNPAIKQLHDQADALDADGQPMVFASRLLTSTPLPERVATTDFFHTIAAAAQETALSFYFLGSTSENLEVAVTAIRRLYPNLKVAGYRNGYIEPGTEENVIANIVASKADVLWLGMGVPKQLDFAVRYRDALTGVKWIKTCGGLFDYFSPKIRRAPKWMQYCGLEWLFRMLQEPNKYMWRYLTTNGHALWLLITRTHDLTPNDSQ